MMQRVDIGLYEFHGVRTLGANIRHYTFHILMIMFLNSSSSLAIICWYKPNNVGLSIIMLKVPNCLQLYKQQYKHLTSFTKLKCSTSSQRTNHIATGTSSMLLFVNICPEIISIDMFIYLQSFVEQ